MEPIVDIVSAAQDKEVPNYVADMHTAWGIIANVNNGDWTKQSKQWQEAAKRWRDLIFHPKYCNIK